MTTESGRMVEFIKDEFLRASRRPVRLVAFTTNEIWVVVCEDDTVWTCPIGSDDDEFVFEGEGMPTTNLITFDFPDNYDDKESGNDD